MQTAALGDNVEGREHLVASPAAITMTALRSSADRAGARQGAITMDTYGHLFPRGDDAAELAAVERLLLG